MTTLPHPSTLITVAPTGAETAKEDFPALPTTLEELVDTAQRCEAAGAAMIHLHIRDHEPQPTLELSRLRDAVQARLRSTNCGPRYPATGGRRRAARPRGSPTSCRRSPQRISL